MRFEIKKIWGVLALVFCLVATDAYAIDDPDLDYFTIETPHFLVHYYSGLEDFAHRVALNCEEAHLSLSPVLNWVPAAKTHVVVTDRADVANGSATTYGRNRMTIYAMPPEADSVLGFYDDWIRVVVYHEYVHILHIDTTLGVAPYVNLLIGKQFNPNQTLPRWYIEGLAVYHESNRTRGGRINGTVWQTWARTAALDGGLLELGTVTGTPVTWPIGNAAYLYGALFLDYVFDKHGEEFGTRFNHIYGTRIVPWSLNRTSREISGESIEGMWGEWSAHANGKAMAERIAVMAAGRTPLQTIYPGGGSTHFSRIRPGHGMTFFSSDLESDTRMIAVGGDGASPRELFDIQGGFGAASWTPDGETLVFSQSDSIKNVYSYQDLWAWDAASNRMRRLTRGERAREPSVSPDGRWVAYVRNLHGTMELVVRELARPTGTERVLVSGRDFPASSDAHWQQISMPTWSLDGSHIAFSWWRLDSGDRDIWQVRVDSPKKRTQLTDDFAMDVDPSFGADGRLYFSSDRSGIFNIYAMDTRTREIQQVSNVVGALTAPVLSADGQWIWATSYTAKGNSIVRFPAKAYQAPAPPSVKDNLSAVTYPPVDTSTFKTDTYQPAPWLAPLLFTPELGVVTSGSAFGGTLSGEDPMSRHLWEVSGAVTFADTIEERGANVGAFYAYRGLPVDVSLVGRYSESPRTRTYYAADEWQPYIQQQWVGRLVLGYPFRGLEDTVSFSASFEVDRATFSEVPEVEPDPGDPEPTEPFEGWFNELSLSLSYTNLRRYAQSISVEEGVIGNVSVGLQDPALGSEFQSLRLSYGGSAFLSMPWLKRHVLALSLSGGHIATVDTNPGVYSLGGNRPQDILSSIIFQEPRFSRVIRGYQPAVMQGPNYQLWSLQYRFPIFDMQRGFSTLPIFFRQLKASVFADSGSAYSGFLADAEFRTGLGAELLLQTTFAYYFSGALRVGYAHGIDEDGIDEFYFLYGGGF